MPIPRGNGVSNGHGRRWLCACEVYALFAAFESRLRCQLGCLLPDDVAADAVSDVESFLVEHIGALQFANPRAVTHYLTSVAKHTAQNHWKAIGRRLGLRHVVSLLDGEDAPDEPDQGVSENRLDPGYISDGPIGEWTLRHWEIRVVWEAEVKAARVRRRALFAALRAIDARDLAVIRTEIRRRETPRACPATSTERSRYRRACRRARAVLDRFGFETSGSDGGT